MSTLKQQTILIAVFAVIKFLVPFVFIDGHFELQRDEYLYLADADHLAWGYIEMPPMLALLGFISQLFHGSLYAVYFWSSLFGALTLVITGKTVQRLGGNVYGVFIACLAFLCSGFLRMHILFQPNFLDVFFWSSSAYFFVCLIKSDDKKYLYYIGICFGLGMLSKYTMAFFILAFLIAILSTQQRKYMANKHFYFAMLGGFLLWLPNLLWQYNHHFPVVHHMQLLNEQQLNDSNRKDFFIGQILITLPCFFVWIIGLWYVFVNKQGRKYMAMGILYIGIIALLAWFKGKEYYAAGIYPVMLGIGAFHLSNSISSYKIKILQWALPAVIIGILYFVFPALLPYTSPQKLDEKYKQINGEKMGMLRWEDGKKHALPQDFADMLGWKEIAEKTAKAYHQLPDSIKGSTVIFADNYGQAGALNFYKKKFDLPEVYSDDASFAFWLPEKFDKQNLLFLDDEPRDTDDYVFGHFKKLQVLDSLTNTYAREYGVKIMLYSQPDDSLRIVSQKAIKELKGKFGSD